MGPGWEGGAGSSPRARWPHKARCLHWPWGARQGQGPRRPSVWQAGRPRCCAGSARSPGGAQAGCVHFIHSLSGRIPELLLPARLCAGPGSTHTEITGRPAPPVLVGSGPGLPSMGRREGRAERWDGRALTWRAAPSTRSSRGHCRGPWAGSRAAGGTWPGSRPCPAVAATPNATNVRVSVSLAVKCRQVLPISPLE